MTKHTAAVRRSGVTLFATALGSALLLMLPSTAGALEPKVPLGTSANFSVLAGSAVTNTGPSILHQSLGVSTGTSLTGWGGTGNGQVVAPGTTENNTALAAQAQSASTAAYTNAMNRTVTATEPADLTGLRLGGGVYNASSNGALQVTGALTLDGAGDPNTVFIFTTDSSLTTGPGSVINVINGAQECNIFWRVGSTATLHGGSVFRGTILAQTSAVLDAAVTVHGRVLAQTAEVTLIDDTFDAPTCATSLPAPVTVPAPATTVPGGGTPTTLAPGSGLPGGATPTTLGLTVGIVGPPRTGVAPLPAHTFPWPAVLLAGFGGVATVGLIARRRLHTRAASR